MTNKEKPLVLIVEDHPQIAEMLQALVEKSDARWELVESAAEALEHRPSVAAVVTDWGLKDGGDAGRRVIERYSAHRVPVIVISGTPSIETEALGMGAQTFIPKPFSMGTFLDAVSSALKVRQHLP